MCYNKDKENMDGDKMRKLRHRTRRKNKQRKIIIISICSLLLFMTIGYAAMNTNLEINAKGNVVKNDTLGEDIIESAGVVTNGDGLYKDNYEENVYTYRGANPNNYVTFNEEQWRIISVNTEDNTIKIIRNAVLLNKAFDTTNNGRYQGSGGYCNSIGDVGCNIWGSSSSLYDINMNPITKLAMEYNGISKLALPNAEAELNTYLNTTYYNSFNPTAQSMIKEDAIYKVGVLNRNNSQTTPTDIEQVSATKWKGKVALIDATEYVRASAYSSCTGTGAYWNNGSCYATSNTHNWMYLNNYWWTLSPYSNITSGYVWFVSSNYLRDDSTDNTRSVRPVVTLSPNVKITSGDGSQNNSYQLSI